MEEVHSGQRSIAGRDNTMVYPMKYSLEPRLLASLGFLGLLGACFEPDPNTLEGAIETAAVAVERGDARALFRVIDVRTRHAMGGIVDARNRSRELVRKTYPIGQADTELTRLGPEAATATDLFAQRCDAVCLADFASKLGAPESSMRHGNVTVVTTVRGTRLDMYSVDGGWFGLLWRLQELEAERDRASRDLEQIGKNAALYRRRAELAR